MTKKTAHDKPNAKLGKKPKGGGNSVPDMAAKAVNSTNDYCCMHGGISQCTPTDHADPAAKMRDKQFEIRDRMRMEPQYKAKILASTGAELLFKEYDKTVHTTLLFFRLYYNDEGNLVPICTDCNSKKSDTSPRLWFNGQQTLFGPFAQFLKEKKRTNPDYVKDKYLITVNDKTVEVGLGDALRDYVERTHFQSGYTRVHEEMTAQYLETARESHTIVQLAHQNPAQAQQKAAAMTSQLSVSHAAGNTFMDVSKLYPEHVDAAMIAIVAKLPAFMLEETKKVAEQAQAKQQAASSTNSTSSDNQKTGSTQQKSQAKPTTG